MELADSKTLLLSSFKGKVVIAEFLLTTCPHCQQCSQVLQKLYKEYGPRGFQPVGIAVNDMAKMLIPDFQKNFGITFPVGVGRRESVYNYLEIPSIFMMSFPTVAVIDKKFTVRQQHLGGDDIFREEEKNFRTIIESLLNDKPAAPVSSKKSAAPKTT